MRFNLSVKALTLIAIPLLIDLTLIGGLFLVLQRADSESVQLNNSRALVQRTDHISRLVTDVALLTVKKRFGIGYGRGYEKTRQREIEEIESELAEMLKLAQNSPAKESYVKAYEIAIRVVELFKASKTKDSGGLMEALEGYKELTPEYERGMALMAEANALETKSVNEALERESKMRQDVRNLIILGFLTNLAAALIAMLLFFKGITQRLSALMENAYKLPRGEKFSPPLGGNDEIGQLDVVLRTTALELAQARQNERFLIENMPVALASLRKDGSIGLVNPEMEKLFSSTAEKLHNKPISDLLSIGDDTMLVPGKQFEFRLKNSESEQHVEVLIRQFGSTRLAAMLDITERLATQRLRRQFVAMVSHDLRTPLANVSASLEMLFDGRFGDVNEAGQKQLGRAQRSVDRMLLLINDLLDLEKIESASFKLNPAIIRADDVIERAIETASIRAQESGVNLTYEHTIVECWADGERVIQVLINLIDNAIKFSQPGQKVVVSTILKEKFLEFRVTDEGRGIPPEMQEQVFERFMQVSKEDRKKRHGSGLGLAICKAIVESHGGEIGLNSAVGRGTTFWFRLPLEENSNGKDSAG